MQPSHDDNRPMGNRTNQKGVVSMCGNDRRDSAWKKKEKILEANGKM